MVAASGWAMCCKSSWTMSVFPNRDAMWRGVWSSCDCRMKLEIGIEPITRRNIRYSEWGFTTRTVRFLRDCAGAWHQKYGRRRLTLAMASTSAPFRNKQRTTSIWPARAAMCRAVSPRFWPKTQRHYARHNHCFVLERWRNKNQGEALMWLEWHFIDQDVCVCVCVNVWKVTILKWFIFWTKPNFSMGRTLHKTSIKKKK